MPAESIRNGAYSAGAVAARRQNGVAVPFRERRLVERLSMRTNHSPGQGHWILAPSISLVWYGPLVQRILGATYTKSERFCLPFSSQSWCSIDRYH